jgi:NitT/TauT family transport system ATP-binding protein
MGIVLNNIIKRFELNDVQKCITVLDNVSFNVDDDEFICILGPSGCGKSTLLKMLAGLESIDEGIISI